MSGPTGPQTRRVGSEAARIAGADDVVALGDE